MEYVFLAIILVISIALFVYGVKKKKMEHFINFMLRMAGGALGLYLVNSILSWIQFDLNVGINAYNLLTFGLLGTPGFLLVYGVEAYAILKL